MGNSISGIIISNIKIGFSIKFYRLYILNLGDV